MSSNESSQGIKAAFKPPGPVNSSKPVEHKPPKSKAETFPKVTAQAINNDKMEKIFKCSKSPQNHQWMKISNLSVITSA